MKDIIIEHKYKLSELLDSIRQVGAKARDYETAYKDMIYKIEVYLEMIEK